jgi:hypothetical protein
MISTTESWNLRREIEYGCAFITARDGNTGSGFRSPAGFRPDE